MMAAAAAPSTDVRVHWRRLLAISSPVLTRPFWALAAISALGLLLCIWRELAGLAAATAMNDGYSWGMFKNFNVTTLTALGSGGYAMAVLTYVFDRHKYHTLMRTALLTSILVYTAGMFALAVDIGRPWNILYMADPWTWNTHSILFEVALCMTAYVMIALDFENLAPLLEYFMDDPFPNYVQDVARFARRMVKKLYPYGVALALVLPTMHQSSLGSLMLLSGSRVHPLWQTPLLPLLYVVMAFSLGLAFVNVTLMASCVVWKRPMDRDLLASVSDIVSWISLLWIALRSGDVYGRGVLDQAFRFDFYSFIFLAEMLLIAVPALVLRSRSVRERPPQAFTLLFAQCLGGMLYRYAPTTLAFIPGPGYHYFPSVTELLIGIGFITLPVVGYLFTVKRFAILPATLQMALRSERPKLKFSKEQHA